MTVPKARNRSFILKIVLLTILMIAALSVVFIGIIFQFIDGFNIPGIGGIVVGLFVGYWSIKQMKHLNGSWVRQMIDEIRKGEIESSLQWNFDEEEWSEFVQWKKVENKKDIKGTIIWTGVIATVIFFAMAYSSLDLIPLLLISIVAGCCFGVLISLLIYWGNSVSLRKMSSESNGKVWFTEHAILVNDLLIYFNQMGTTVGKMIIEEDAKIGPLVQLTTTVSTGTRTTEKTYTFPVPNGSIEDAKSLVNFYSR